MLLHERHPFAEAPCCCFARRAFDHLAWAAFRAISLRCSGVSFSIRAFRALRARATAYGFLRRLIPRLYATVSIAAGA